MGLPQEMTAQLTGMLSPFCFSSHRNIPSFILYLSALQLFLEIPHVSKDIRYESENTWGWRQKFRLMNLGSYEVHMGKEIDLYKILLLIQITNVCHTLHVF
jgi:hypothetical protein